MIAAAEPFMTSLLVPKSCRPPVLLFLLVAVCGFLQHSGVYAESASGDDNRKRAFELFEQDKRLEALPLFEELALKSPDDRDITRPK